MQLFQTQTATKLICMLDYKYFTVYLLKSFGVDEMGGNPAGVVLDANNLSDEQKKAISKAINYSETAFVERSDKADYKVRFFTPTEEVDLCGHATIATYSLLFQRSLDCFLIYENTPRNL